MQKALCFEKRAKRAFLNGERTKRESLNLREAPIDYDYGISRWFTATRDCIENMDGLHWLFPHHPVPPPFPDWGKSLARQSPFSSQCP